VRELIKRTDFVFATMIETMLDVRRAIFDGYSRLHRVVLPLVQRDPICRRLMTVPLSDQSQRFRSRSRSMIPCALSGHGPSRAFCCMSGSGPHCAPWGLRIAWRSRMLCAIVAVALKLAGILHRMWVDGNDVKVGFGTKMTRRLKLKPA